MESSVITSTEEFRNLKTEWNALLEKSGQNNVFLDFNWLFYRWQFLEKENSLFIVTVKDETGIVGIAPFMLSKKSCFSALALIGEKVSDYEDIITLGSLNKREEIISSILAVIQHSGLWSIFRLKGIRSDSPNLPVFKKLFGNQLHSHCDGAPYIGINQGWEEYCGNLRKKIIADSKRQKNRLESDHPSIRLEHITDIKQIEVYLNQLAGFHRDIRNRKNTPSLFDNDINMAFFRQVVDIMLKEDKLVFSVLKTDKETAALHMGFADKGIFYYYIPAYNPNFSKYSIGRLLLMELIKYAFEHKFQRFDFMLGQEDYKQQWATEKQALYFINAFSLSPAGRIALGLSVIKLKAKKILGRKW